MQHIEPQQRVGIDRMAAEQQEVDLVADQPGLTLFHCHIQQHMDYGFKALFRYA